MEYTIYSEKQIIQIVADLRKREVIEEKGINSYLEFLREHPDTEISEVAKKYPGDEWDFIKDLENCPRFAELMEAPWHED